MVVLSIEESKFYLTQLIKERRGGYSVAINALKILQYRKDEKTRQIIDEAILQTPDGFGAVISFKWLHNLNVIKLDLPGLVLDTSNENKLGLFLLGTSEDNNRDAALRIAELYPHINISGRMNGFFEDINDVKKLLIESKPDIVMIAMGSPKQEILSAQLFKEFPEVLFIGCGGRFDILAGKVNRAPDWYIRNNLEWFYRLIKQPKRIKQQVGIIKFVMLLFFYKFSEKNFSYRIKA